jgi:hypothetical protein
MPWMGRRDGCLQPQKGAKARITFLGFATVVTASFFFEPMGRMNAKIMQIGGMQITTLLSSGSIPPVGHPLDLKTT